MNLLYKALLSLMPLFIGACFVFPVNASAGPGQLPSAASIVRHQAFVSVDPAPRGEAFEAALVVEIAKGFHMNSHKPSEDYLIPTTLTPQLPPGIRLLDTTYPPGQQRKFAFSPDKPLDVYGDSVTLKLKLTVAENAPLGIMSIPATLRYQACNDTTCLAPVKVPIIFRIEVGAAGTPGQRMHPDIFSSATRPK